MAQANKNSRSKKFLKDFGVYSIGVLGSKLITFLMVPFYTYFIENPSDFGDFDICLQICMMLVPIVTLQLRDGAFRFLLETHETEKRTRIVSSVYRTLFLTTSITLVITLTVSLFYPIKYLWYTVALLVTMSFYEVLAQVIRGLGNNKAFISVGLIASFGIGIFSLIFVAWFKMGVAGIFLANILARLLSIAIVESWMQTFRKFFSVNIDKKAITREIIRYSLPLIPVTLCELLPPLSDRFFLKHFIGMEHEGIYAISVRLCGVIHTLAIIFYQTWQENAIQQYHSQDRDKFFSKVFNSYIFLLVAVLVGYTFSLKMCFSWLIAPNYQHCLTYLYPMGMSWVIIAICNYFYLPYQCAKNTKGVVPAIIFLAVINVVFNYLLVPRIGIYGVIVTSIIGYLSVACYLWKDTKRYFNLHVNRNTFVPISIMFFSILPFYFISSTVLDFIYILVIYSVLFFSTPRETRHEAIKKLKIKMVLHNNRTIKH